MNPAQHHQPQPPVQQQHPGADQDEARQHRGDQPVEALVEQLRDRVDVRRLPGDHPPRGVGLVERHRQPQQVREQPAAQLQHHRLAEPAGEGDEHPRRRRLDQHRHARTRAAMRSSGTGSDRLTSGGMPLSIARPISQGPASEAQRRHHDRGRGQRDRPPVRAQQVAQQPAAALAQQRLERGRDLVHLLGRDAAPRRRAGAAAGAGVRRPRLRRRAVSVLRSPPPSSSGRRSRAGPPSAPGGCRPR